MRLRHRPESSVLTALLAGAVVVSSGCSKHWTTYRHNPLRTAHQPNATDLSDPSRVPGLATVWSWQMPAVTTSAQRRQFRGSPVVRDGRVFIGGLDGYFRAFDANTGTVVWQYPAPGDPPLTSQFRCNPSSYGIANTAAMARVGGEWAVIFGAPDPSAGTGLGEGRLFALRASDGAVIWKSPVLARVTGTTSGSTSERHEQIGYSSPLVFGDKVYVGIANHCDNPIQQGKVRAVRLSDGSLVGSFDFVGAAGAGGTRRPGGGVWSAPATDLLDIYVTTGNVASANPGGEPPVNHALSLLRLDEDTGAVRWKLQPVPFELDGDPDWASGPTTVLGSCETLVASTMKDGWTYAARTGGASPGPVSVRWQFPPTGFPFSAGDGTSHGDTRFLRAGAAWGDVFVTMTGGLNILTNLTSNYSRLHALNACASGPDRIRWIKDVPHTTGGWVYKLGPPTVTRGIVYVGTGDGWLVAIADPSVHPPDGFRCEHPDVPNSSCFAAGFSFVPDPHVLAQVQLQGAIRTEPVLADGRVFVATDAGRLYALEP